MMVRKRRELPLYTDGDYYYTISLQGNAYKIRFYYNERIESWSFDLRLSDDTPLVLGASLVKHYPIFIDYYLPNLTGYFWLEEIGKDINNTVTHNLEIWKYYKLYYIWEE